MTETDYEQVLEEKFRAAQKLTDAEDSDDLIAAAYWRGRMGAMAEVERGEITEDGLPPDLTYPDGALGRQTGTWSKVVGSIVILLVVVALFWGAWEMVSTLVSIVS